MDDSTRGNNSTNVSNVMQRLRTYRDTKAVEKAEEDRRIQEQSEQLQQQAAEAYERRNAPRPLNFLESSAIDVLDIYPLRKWREFNQAYPLQCWVITISMWLIGQLMAIRVEFGFVFLLFSLFALIFLNMGTRAEGELSAYSVFNPNLERLPGQLTAEHFERDMLMQRRYDED